MTQLLRILQSVKLPRICRKRRTSNIIDMASLSIVTVLCKEAALEQDHRSPFQSLINVLEVGQVVSKVKVTNKFQLCRMRERELELDPGKD